GTRRDCARNVLAGDRDGRAANRHFRLWSDSARARRYRPIVRRAHERARAGPHRAAEPDHVDAPDPDCRTRREESASGDVSVCGVHRERWPHGVLGESHGTVSPFGHVRGQDPPGNETSRPTHRTAHEVPAGDQPQDRQGARPHDPSVVVTSSGSNNRVMNRRAFVTGLGALLAAPFGAEAQQARRIGYLVLDLTEGVPCREAFRQGLRDLGYVDGRNVAIEYRDAGGKPERLAARAAELVALNVDVIVAPGTLASLAAKRATATIPVVVPTIGDPVADGLVKSLARPGGNVTGLSNLSPELIGKCMQLLKEAVPGTTRVAVLTHTGSATAKTDREYTTQARASGRSLGFAVQLVDARRPMDFDSAF